VHDGLAYVGARPSGLGILDVSGNATPTLRGFAQDSRSGPRGVSVSGGVALVTDTVSGVDFVRSRRSSETHANGIPAFSMVSRRTSVASGNVAYAADRPTGFYVFDLSKTDSFEPVGTTQSGVPNQHPTCATRSAPGIFRSSCGPPGGRRTPAAIRRDESRQPHVVAILPVRPGLRLRIALRDHLVYVATARRDSRLSTSRCRRPEDRGLVSRR
jgi:hypothetical protein